MVFYHTAVKFAHGLEEMRGGLLAADSNCYFIVEIEFSCYYHIYCRAYDQRTNYKEIVKSGHY